MHAMLYVINEMPLRCRQRIKTTEQPVENNETFETVRIEPLYHWDFAQLPLQGLRPPLPVRRHYHNIMIELFRINGHVSVEPHASLTKFRAQLFTQCNNVDDGLGNSYNKIDILQVCRRRLNNLMTLADLIAKLQVSINTRQAPFGSNCVVLRVAAVDCFGESFNKSLSVVSRRNSRRHTARVVVAKMQSRLICASRAVE